jgi:hypothetical protein
MKVSLSMISLVCWLVLALVHMPPAAALFRPGLIRTLYGVDPGSETFLLLHHRAALFLSVSLVCGWAALHPEVRPLASVVVGLSLTSFLWLFIAAGGPSGLRMIALADVVALPFAVTAAWLAFQSSAKV